MLLTPTRRRATDRKAFTLMEVLVVVAILVILAGVAIIAVPRYIDDARKSRAHLAAQSLAQACEAYHLNSANADGGYPQDLQQLVQPSFGGASFVKTGPQDLMTPWGQKFNYEVSTKSDQTQYPLVWTTAPDGTEISNFGIGQNARPKF
jgi:general secretion pathway protein G